MPGSQNVCELMAPQTHGLPRHPSHNGTSLGIPTPRAADLWGWIIHPGESGGSPSLGWGSIGLLVLRVLSLLRQVMLMNHQTWHVPAKRWSLRNGHEWMANGSKAVTM